MDCSKALPLMDAVRAIDALLEGIDPPPNVEIDSVVFRDQGIESAPVMTAEGPGGLLAPVAGLCDPAGCAASAPRAPAAIWACAVPPSPSASRT
jgi:hypothetical protein